MKKLIGVLSVVVFSMIMMNTAFASEPAVQQMGKQGAEEGLAEETFLHTVWPFPKSSEPYPGDPATKVASAIDSVKIDLSLDPADKTYNPPKPEAD